ncbi:MAG: SBBP repeat-containing protein [Leptospiraceae bacterium]|nr:SBBP repeat-containing protein [Leptospiraceae bacterium]
MKTLQPNRFKVNFGITLLCTLLISTACKSNNHNNTNTILWMFALTNSSATSTAPTISSFAPSSGSVGTSVTISGTNFSSITTQNTVKFNGTEATVSEASSTSLTVIVPAGTSTGKISVTTTIGSVTSSEDFTVSSTSTSLVLFTKQLGNGIKSTKAQAVATDSNGYIYMAGETGSGLDGNSQAGTMDFFVVKYNSSGTSQWTKQMGVTSKETQGKGIATDSNGNLYIVGYTNGGLDGNTLSGTYDVFVVKYDSNGSKQWTRQMGTNSKVTDGRGIATSSDGIYVTGAAQGSLDGNTTTGDYDAFVIKFNLGGSKQWTKLLGATSSSTESYGVATDSNGSIYTVGYTDGILDENKYSGSGATQAFITNKIYRD